MVKKMHMDNDDGVALCGAKGNNLDVTSDISGVTCGNCRKRLGARLALAVSRMAPAHNPAVPQAAPQAPRRAQVDPRTIAVAYTCSRCRSFVRERIPVRFKEDFQQAVMAKTIRCGC